MGKRSRGPTDRCEIDTPRFPYMTFSQQLREFFYSLSATDKYSDFDSRKSFNRVNKPTVQTSLLYAQENSESSASLASPATPESSDGVHETRLAWWHVKKWLHKHSQDLNATLLSPCTESDLSEFQKDLNIQLPRCVHEFFRMTDGQSTFNSNGLGGLVYNLKLMSIDEIAVMTESWRSVHQLILHRQSAQSSVTRLPSVARLQSGQDFGSDLASIPKLSVSSDDLGLTRKPPKHETAFPDQRAVPPGTVLPVYAHSMWIPIITDGVGNCIAIDLSAPPDGDTPASDLRVWGQVIIFGRDFDTKFKIADNFGDFLLIFANDLELGNWELRSSTDNEEDDLMVGSDTELIYVDHETKKELPYLDVLRTRATDKWLATLSDEQKSEKENADLIAYLNKEFAHKVPELAESSMDNMISDNLRTMDVFNVPAAADRGGSGDNLDDDIN